MTIIEVRTVTPAMVAEGLDRGRQLHDAAIRGFVVAAWAHLAAWVQSIVSHIGHDGHAARA